MLVCVEVIAAMTDASGVALNAPTSCAAVRERLDLAGGNRHALQVRADPFSADTTISDAPSVDQTIGLRFCPRGAA